MFQFLELDWLFFIYCVIAGKLLFFRDLVVFFVKWDDDFSVYFIRLLRGLKSQYIESIWDSIKYVVSIV